MVIDYLAFLLDNPKQNVKYKILKQCSFISIALTVSDSPGSCQACYLFMWSDVDEGHQLLNI